jgi:hypothetical protein
MLPRANREDAQARSKPEYLEVLRKTGFGKARGQTSGHVRTCTAPVAPMTALIPLVILGSYARESVFARWWMARYVRIRAWVPEVVEVAV